MAKHHEGKHHGGHPAAGHPDHHNSVQHQGHIRHVVHGHEGHGHGEHEISEHWPPHESIPAEGVTGGPYGTPAHTEHVKQHHGATERHHDPGQGTHHEHSSKHTTMEFPGEGKHSEVHDSPASHGRHEMPHKEDVGKAQEAAREIEHIGNEFHPKGVMHGR